MAMQIRCNRAGQTKNAQGDFEVLKSFDIVNVRGKLVKVSGIIVQLIEKTTAFKRFGDDTVYSTNDDIMAATSGCVDHMCRTYLEIFDVVDGSSLAADSFSNGPLATYLNAKESRAADKEAASEECDVAEGDEEENKGDEEEGDVAEGEGNEEVAEELDEDEDLEAIADEFDSIDIPFSVPDNSAESDAFDEEGNELTSTEPPTSCGRKPYGVQQPFKRCEWKYLTKGLIKQTGVSVFISDPENVAAIKAMTTWKKSINSSAHDLPYTYDVELFDEIAALSETASVRHDVRVVWGYVKNTSLIYNDIPAIIKTGGGTRRLRLLPQRQRRYTVKLLRR
jgi:hypothetical protein